MSEPTPISKILGYCEHNGAILSRNEANNAIGMYCDECRSWCTRAKGYDKPWLGKDHPALVGVDLKSLPAVGERHYRKCQGPCGRLELCEYHHLAPRAFFADECDEWPTAYLCRDCHRRWHTLVTPGLCTAHDAIAHAEMLLDYLGLERAAHLTKALIARGQARRAGAA